MRSTRSASTVWAARSVRCSQACLRPPRGAGPGDQGQLDADAGQATRGGLDAEAGAAEARTIETAETGHLVFGTLHTTTAASTVDRIIDQFPINQQEQIRAVLSVLAGGERTAYRIDGIADRDGWTPVSGAADVLWTGALEDATLMFRTVGTSEDILLDDAFLTFENAPPSLAPIGDQTVERLRPRRLEPDQDPFQLLRIAHG